MAWVIPVGFRLGQEIGKAVFGDQEWRAAGYEIDKEIGLVQQRSQGGDHYPQGVGSVLDVLRAAKRHNRIVVVRAKKTLPKWTWYIYVQ